MTRGRSRSPWSRRSTCSARTTYRSLLATGVRGRAHGARATAASWTRSTSAVGDRLFLDGAVVPVSPTFTVALGADGWEVDGGLVHGFPRPRRRRGVRAACSDDDGHQAGIVAGDDRRDRALARRSPSPGSRRTGPTGRSSSRCRCPGRGPARPAAGRRAGRRPTSRRCTGRCRPPSRRPDRAARRRRRCASSTRRRASPGALRLRVAVRARHGAHPAGRRQRRSSATSSAPTAPAPGSSSAASSTSPRGSSCGRWATTHRRSPSWWRSTSTRLVGDEPRRPATARRSRPTGLRRDLPPGPDGTWVAPRCSWSCAATPTATSTSPSSTSPTASAATRWCRRRARRRALVRRRRWRSDPGLAAVGRGGRLRRGGPRLAQGDRQRRRLRRLVVHDATARPAAAPRSATAFRSTLDRLAARAISRDIGGARRTPPPVVVGVDRSSSKSACRNTRRSDSLQALLSCPWVVDGLGPVIVDVVRAPDEVAALEPGSRSVPPSSGRDRCQSPSGRDRADPRRVSRPDPPADEPGKASPPAVRASHPERDGEHRPEQAAPLGRVAAGGVPPRFKSSSPPSHVRHEGAWPIHRSATVVPLSPTWPGTRPTDAAGGPHCRYQLGDPVERRHVPAMTLGR